MEFSVYRKSFPKGWWVETVQDRNYWVVGLYYDGERIVKETFPFLTNEDKPDEASVERTVKMLRDLVDTYRLRVSER